MSYPTSRLLKQIWLSILPPVFVIIFAFTVIPEIENEMTVTHKARLLRLLEKLCGLWFFYFRSNTFPLFHNHQIIRLRSTFPFEVGPTGETRQYNFVLSRLNRTT